MNLTYSIICTERGNPVPLPYLMAARVGESETARHTHGGAGIESAEKANGLL